MLEILLKHNNRYPQMQFYDYLKLIYQNEFGCGHMITNKESSLLRIQQEYNEVDTDFGEIFEDIGNNLCRLHLAPAKSNGLSPETINNWFIVSANNIMGNIDSFESKLVLLKQFLAHEDNNFQTYKVRGYQAVGHSDVFRKLYSPHYRVVSRVFKEHFEDFCKIDKLSSGIIAIDGQSASGKTSFCNVIKQMYDCNVIHTDDFFLQPYQRTQNRLTEVGGNIDYERFKLEVVDNLKTGNPFTYGVYSCDKEYIDNTITIYPKDLTIIEGAYSTHSYFGEYYDMMFLFTVDRDEQLIRIKKRNGAEMLKTFVSTWIPMENKYLSTKNI